MSHTERSHSAASWAISSPASKNVGKCHDPRPIVNASPSDLLGSYKLAAIKLMTPSKEHLEKHYEDLSEKPFFKGLVTCTSSTRSHNTSAFKYSNQAYAYH